MSKSKETKETKEIKKNVKESNELVVKSVHLQEAIRFRKETDLTFFSINTAFKNTCIIEVDKELGGVHFKSKDTDVIKDHVFVPIVNVKSICFCNKDEVDKLEDNFRKQFADKTSVVTRNSF